MRITIEINCDNAAFEDDPAQEVKRILSNLSLRFDEMFTLPVGLIPLLDTNGNTVGSAEMSD